MQIVERMVLFYDVLIQWITSCNVCVITTHINTFAVICQIKPPSIKGTPQKHYQNKCVLPKTRSLTLGNLSVLPSPISHLYILAIS